MLEYSMNPEVRVLCDINLHWLIFQKEKLVKRICDQEYCKIIKFYIVCWFGLFSYVLKNFIVVPFLDYKEKIEQKTDSSEQTD